MFDRPNSNNKLEESKIIDQNDQTLVSQQDLN